MSTQSYDNFGRDCNLVWICNFYAFPNFSQLFLSTTLRVITATKASNLTTLQRDHRWTKVSLLPWDHHCTPPARFLVLPNRTGGNWKYDIFRKDRSSHGRGVFIGIRNDIITTEQVRLDVHNCEIITASIKLAKSKTLLLSSYYRPPAPNTNALDFLDDVLSRIYSSL